MSKMNMGWDGEVEILRQESGFYLLDKYQSGSGHPHNYGYQVWDGEPVKDGKCRGEFDDIKNANLFFTTLLFQKGA